MDWKKSSIILFMAGLLIIPFFIITGCGDPPSAGVTAPVWIEVMSIFYVDPDVELSQVATIDVCDLNEEDDVYWCVYLDELCSITFAVHPTNPEYAGSSAYMDVHLKKLRVSFRRNDGGSNVPGSFDQNIDLYLPYNTSSEHSVKILHADQKLDPPLIWLNSLESYGFEPETGSMIIKGTAYLQFWGKDNAGNNVEVATQIPVQFADWGDPT